MESVNIKPGMFIREKFGSVYHEVSENLGSIITCASIDPKDKRELISLNDIASCVETPPNNSWIKMNREKGFYDKLYPEGWLPCITEVRHFSDLKENDVVIGKKGEMKLIKKDSSGKWKTAGKQKTLAGKDSFFIFLIQREAAPKY